MKIFIALLLFLVPIALHAQSAGASGMSFLKNGAGARNSALGDNGTVMALDASGVFYNPANLALNKSDNVFLMHNEWIQGAASEVAAARVTVFGVPIGIGVNSTTISDIEIRTRPGDKEGTFNAHYFAASLSSAMPVTNDIFAGATVKYLYEGLYVDEASGLAVDAGLTWRNAFEHIHVSAAVKNIGSMNTLRSEATKLPSDIRFGALYDTFKPVEHIAVSGSVEIQHYFASEDFHVNMGVEAGYDDMFFVRLGWMTMYEAKSFTTGIGVRWHSVSLDYALIPFSYDLGSAHTFSALIEF